MKPTMPYKDPQQRLDYYSGRVVAFAQVIYQAPAQAIQAIEIGIASAGILTTLSRLEAKPQRFGRLNGSGFRPAKSKERQNALFVVKPFVDSLKRRHELQLEISHRRELNAIRPVQQNLDHER